MRTLSLRSSLIGIALVAVLGLLGAVAVNATPNANARPLAAASTDSSPGSNATDDPSANPALAPGIDAVAASLNMTPVALKQNVAAGRTLHAMADAQGLSKDQFKAATRANFKKALDRAVSTGRMSPGGVDRLTGLADKWIDTVWDQDLSRIFAARGSANPIR